MNNATSWLQRQGLLNYDAHTMGELQTDPDRILAAFCSACADRCKKSTTWRGKFIASGPEARILKRCPDCVSERIFFDRITEKAHDRLINKRKARYEKYEKENYGSENGFSLEAAGSFA